MWIRLLLLLVLYRLIRLFFDDDDNCEVDTSDSDVNFLVAQRIEKLFNGKVYLGLRIPDADTSSRQSIDMVLVSEGEAVVISVKNFSGFVGIDAGGSWLCNGENKCTTERHPDPMLETKRQVAILEAYLKQRGLTLPEGYLCGKVALPNPNFRTIHSIGFPPEVITYDQLMQLKPQSRSFFAGWIKDAFRGRKNDMQESINQQLNSILSTAPKWDRVELKNNKCLLGEFLEFKGMQEDIRYLRNIKRSKVSQLIMRRSTIFAFGCSELHVRYCPRDYRSEGASASEWMEVTVRSGTELIFKPQNSSKVRKFKLFSVASMSLSV